MRLKRHVPLLESTLKHVAARPLLSSQCTRCRRRYASSSAAYPEQIAVLGGGISGLSSAYFISKEFPKSKITVFESSKDAGGWIKSRKVKVPGGEVLFEYGPRSLRPGANALPTAQLIQDLGLASEVLYTPKDSPAAKNRYIYYPDRLNRLPSNANDLTLSRILSLWNSGILNGTWNLVSEAWQPKRPSGYHDESIGDFISRRADKRVANNLVSAVFHGIYAGDIYQLSARSLMSLPWRLEEKYGSALWGIAKMHQDDDRGKTDALTLWHPYDFEEYKAMREDIQLEQDFLDKLAPGKTSTFTFKNGLQQLVTRMEERLRENGQVEIRTATPVQSFRKAKDAPEQIEVVAGDKSSPETRNFDFVVSTLANAGLTDSVTVMVVNLFYRNPNLAPVQGFGYLIPRSVPFEQNPERALGVIFDHDAVQGQDTVSGTKLTVMLGGHWWNGWQGYPDSDEGAELAKSVIQRHLGITEEPDVCHVTLNSNCIPQYTVGYEDRLKDVAVGLQNMYNGKLRVVGTQVNGVGVNDCIKGAWNLARGMRGNGWKQRSAGLDRVLDERAWSVEPAGRMGKKKMPVAFEHVSDK